MSSPFPSSPAHAAPAVSITNVSDDDDEDADEFYDPAEYSGAGVDRHSHAPLSHHHYHGASSVRSTRSQSNASQSASETTMAHQEPVSPSPSATLHQPVNTIIYLSQQNPSFHTTAGSGSSSQNAISSNGGISKSHSANVLINTAASVISFTSVTPSPPPTPGASATSASHSYHHARSSSFNSAQPALQQSLLSSPSSHPPPSSLSQSQLTQALHSGKPPLSPSGASVESLESSRHELSSSSTSLQMSSLSPSPHRASPLTPANLYHTHTSGSPSSRSRDSRNQILQIRNLDTDESCALNEAEKFFPEVGQTLTIVQLEAFERQKLESMNQSTSQPSIATSLSAPSLLPPSLPLSLPTPTPSASPNVPLPINDESQKLTESEVNERRRTLGILGKLAKTFSMSSSTSTALTNSSVGGRVKTKAKHSTLEVLDDLYHVQTLMAGAGPIWCVAVSHDGQFVATGGQDSIVRVWAVMGSLAARQIEERQQNNSASAVGSESEHLTLEGENGRHILHPTPFRVCSGHRADITCLSWSSSDDFLLSSSIDKTVCLWHVSSSRCIRVFPHTDLITCIAFHPREHRYFISGSFDNRIRLWNIIESRVVEWAQTAHFVTALTFSPTGHMVVAGLHHGQCVFYATAGLKYHTQLDCRNRSGKHARGKKVTGLEYSRDGQLLLVTTNDSRVRCYRMVDFALHCKMKGMENESLQIKASFHEEADSGQLHAIMGSEKELVAVWKIPTHENRAHAHPAATSKQRENSQSTSRSQSSHSHNHRLTAPVPSHASPTSAPVSTASSTGQTIKLDAFEYFKAVDDSPVTCALFLPKSSIAFSSAGESQHAMPIRHILLATGLHGELKAFENRIRQPDFATTATSSKGLLKR